MPKAGWQLSNGVIRLIQAGCYQTPPATDPEDNAATLGVVMAPRSVRQDWSSNSPFASGSLPALSAVVG